MGGHEGAAMRTRMPDKKSSDRHGRRKTGGGARMGQVRLSSEVAWEALINLIR